MTKVKLAPAQPTLYRRVGASEWHLSEPDETMSHGNAEYAQYTRSDIADTEIARLRAEIERMREALLRIGKGEKAYCSDGHEESVLIARAALKESGQ